MGIFQRIFGDGDASRDSSASSLHGEMYRLGLVEELLNEAIRGYQALIDAVWTLVPRAIRESRGADYRRSLKQLRNRLDARPSKALLDSTRQQLHQLIGEFSTRLDGQIDQQAREAKQVMAIVAVMAESMAAREKQYNVRFRGIGKKLRLLSTSNDLSEIRRKLEAEVSQLEKYSEEMERDTNAAVARVQTELRQARAPTINETPPPVTASPVASPIEAPGPASNSTASPPAATPVVGRREAELAIDQRRRADLRFCAARFTIRNLAQVAAQWGLPAAAGLVDQAATLLQRDFDAVAATLVARWSERDLVVIADLQLLDAALRVERLEELLAGPYSGSGGQEVRLDVAGSVIERCHGEPSRDTIRRIETMMPR